jgi:hypothetical protein
MWGSKTVWEGRVGKPCGKAVRGCRVERLCEKDVCNAGLVGKAV